MREQVLSGRLLLCLLFAALGVFNAGAANSDVKLLGGYKTSRFSESGEFVWCGDKHLAISKHSRGSDAGIRLLDVSNGNIRQLTTVKTHRVVACTADGKHIFFVENGTRGVMNELDIDKNKQQKVYEENLFQHEVIEDSPVSPSAELLVGPATLSERINLSDRTLNTIHIPKEFSEKYVKGISWSADGVLFIVFGSDSGANKSNLQKLLIMKGRNAPTKIIDLPNIKQAQFMQIGWSDVASRLFLLSWKDVARLYEIDPEKPASSLRLIATDVDDFKLMANGSLVYIKNYGADYSKPDKSTIEEVAHRSLMLRTPHGKQMELLQVPYVSMGVSGIQISPQGESIAVRVKSNRERNGPVEIFIFHALSK